jgi:hypothetical protein
MYAFERVLRIRALRPDQRTLSVGSATLISDRLVLTASHVLLDKETQERYQNIEVALYGEPTFYRAVSVWSGRDGLDAALVMVTDPSWTCPLDRPLVRLGRPTGRAANLPVDSIGFPRFLRGPDQTRDTEHVSGLLNSGTEMGKRYSFKVLSPVPDRPCDEVDPSPWAGLSGAGLASGDMLIGIVIREDGDRLTAVPVQALIADMRLRKVLAEAGYSLVVESIELAPMLQRLPDRRTPTPTTLLRADRGVVKFRPRSELTSLLTWCTSATSDQPLEVQVVTGAGGQGKTRLAYELVRQMAGLGWVAGFLKPDRAGSELNLAALNSTGTRVLIVVDYADTRLRQLGRLLDMVGDTSEIASVRLLLLARSAKDWWEKLQLDFPDALDRATVMPLHALDADDDKRVAAWEAALTAFAAELPKLYQTTRWQTIPETIVQPQDLLSEKYGLPLNLQVAALTALLQAGANPVATANSHEEVLLRHEAKYWQESAAARQLSYQPINLKLAIAAATLVGASTRQLAVDTVKLIPPFCGLGPDPRLAIAQWIAGLYPAPHDEYWGSLEPDPLAEHLVDAVLRDSGAGLLDSLLPLATFDQQVQGLRFLARAKSRSHASDAELRRILADHRAKLVNAAVAVAVLGTTSEVYLDRKLQDIIAGITQDDKEMHLNKLVGEPEGLR